MYVDSSALKCIILILIAYVETISYRKLIAKLAVVIDKGENSSVKLSHHSPLVGT